MRDFRLIILKSKLVDKPLDFVRGQGAIRFKSGAYTLVREHFESDWNAAIGQKMTVYQPVLVPAPDQMHMQMKNNLPSPSLDINK